MTVTSFSFSLPAATPSAVAIGPITSGYVDVEHQEVVWFTSEGTAVVYAYAIDQWRTWDVLPSAAVSLVPTTQDVLSYAPESATTVSYDLDSEDLTAQGTYSTGWILLGGEPQADCQVQEIVIQARRAAEHGVTIQIFRDFNTSTSETKTYSASEITAIASDRYTLAFSPSSMSCRAIKLVLTETDAAGTAMQPLFCTLVYGQLPAPQRAAVKRQGRK